ncbi:hypothetical protein JMJ35_007608 [Cladonia borealis]|uniref:Uncharacterized protein n=1 Tax=Cladonia borealis TaxID=184061 RepID=A0AA39QYC2_9LECA|nr:hypothetical protein JMJ35_007608 [Cladonia borealis]
MADDALHARFTALLQSLPPPSSPSPRTPQYSTHSNNADNIERYLHEDSHTKWGFIIYRCTYASDADWAVFMDRLRYRTSSALETYNGLDMLDSLLPFTVIEDRQAFDNATAATVRDHFKRWVASAPQEEQSQNASAGLSQRYRYCVQVDKMALEAVIRDAPAPPAVDASRKGWVNLVWRDWVPIDEEGEGEEPLEGNVEGWMRVAYQSVMLDMYALLRDLNSWFIEYRRPPEVVCA